MVNNFPGLKPIYCVNSEPYLVLSFGTPGSEKLIDKSPAHPCFAAAGGKVLRVSGIRNVFVKKKVLIV